MLNPVATTAILVAAMRAEESTRPDRLFDDPFAACLAGPAGRAALEHYRAATGPGTPIIEVRTRYFDEGLLRAQASGVRQFVVLAAGMDARAYRLPWQTGVRLFEVDQPDVLAFKAEALGSAVAACERRPVPIDLAQAWPEALVAAGFDPHQPVTWLVEGLLQYLEPTAVETLVQRIDRLSGAGSRFFYDLVGTTLMAADVLAPIRRYMRELGAPWLFASDAPAALVERHGWVAEVVDPAVLGNAWGRWPYPAAPADRPGIARGYLIEAHN
jgi:methyltransferase (TIGR00027 family)